MDLSHQLQAALVVEQQTLAQSHIKYSLQNLGFKRVDLADRAQQAIKALSQHKYDLVLCAYDLNKGADGYQLFERLLNEKLIGTATTFVFMSSENNLELSQSVIELKPDDFLLKPFTSKELELRLKRVLLKKLKLREVFSAIDKKQFSSAVESLNKYIAENTQPRWIPYLLKLKGEIITSSANWALAEKFYAQVCRVNPYPWAKLGWVEALFKQGKLDTAEKLLKTMMDDPKNRLSTLDLMSQICQKNQQFERAINLAKEAVKIAPRNIERQQQVVDLARLTHDFETQYNASSSIVRHLKHSVHETPESYLSAIRSAIDYGLTSMNEDEVDKLASSSEKLLSSVKNSFPGIVLTEQIEVAQARIHHMKNETDKAKRIIQNNLDNKGIYFIDDLEDALDKAKAFHELGFYRDSELLFEAIATACEEQEPNAIFSHYIKSEKELRIEIKDSPKQLNNRAVGFFQRGDYQGAFNAFKAAFKVMPRNVSIALNLMQSIIEHSGLKNNSAEAVNLINRCQSVVRQSTLSEEQQERFERLNQMLEQA